MSKTAYPLAKVGNGRQTHVLEPNGGVRCKTRGRGVVPHPRRRGSLPGPDASLASNPSPLSRAAELLLVPEEPRAVTMTSTT
jgi:hypothetical protein